MNKVRTSTDRKYYKVPNRNHRAKGTITEKSMRRLQHQTR